ncbi:2OG-Fe(II) oxygenase [Gammaproteobacteria bacterium AB-CW1]|uniref:2OG-Fe(II) oxygenase n=1 Tax=Natronospira elongata TaxID=3110268 RepID=A0AAP6ML80_9GAMM|nr:2OG-Fe(II) oxygenase [Gammaproteobacteria bacterium AB-CW1]
MKSLVDALAGPGWGVIDDFLPAETVARLRRTLYRRQKRGSFRDAAVGRAAGRARVKAIRGDRLCWLDPSRARGSEAVWFEQLSALRETLNRELYLGIRGWEGHYALYPPGARYGRHIDRFRDDDARVVSTVFYLNPRWRSEYGGQLRLYPDAADPVDIFPAPGRLVIFLSDSLPHEVITTQRDRLSLVGWFRRD